MTGERLGPNPKLDELMVLVAVSAARIGGNGYNLDVLKSEAERAAQMWEEQTPGTPRSSDDGEVERLRDLLTPRYAQPCFDHEYITPGCPDCGKMA